MLSIHVVSVSCGTEHTIALCQEGVRLTGKGCGLQRERWAFRGGHVEKRLCYSEGRGLWRDL